MITVEQAYKKVIKEDPMSKLSMCLDFGKFWVFFLRPFYMSDDEEYLTGTSFPAVKKDSGELFDYDLTENVNAYENAKEVEVNTIWDTKL